MKKVLFGVALVSVFAACNTKKDETKRDMLYLTDTSNLNSNVSADTALLVPVAPVATAPLVATPARNTSSTRSRTTTRRSSSGTNNNNNNNGSSTSGNNNSGTDNTTTTPARKEGWSKAAKGATIGGVAGAAAGAVITKSAKGAVIGGVIGAGGGYIIGRKKDRQSGRVN
ncbi:MAG: glycine zipper domain-containing protein [Ferruginibacter sp.]